MQVWAGHPAAPAHTSDLLPCRHRVSLRYVGSAQVKVGGYQSSAVVDVDRPAGQVEVGHHGHYTASGGIHRLSDSPGKVGPQMPALHLAIVDTRRAEPTGDPAGSGKSEASAPEATPLLRHPRNLPASCDLRPNARDRGAVGLGVSRGHGQALAPVAARANPDRGEDRVAAVTPRQEDRHWQRVFRFDGNPDQTAILTLRILLEVNRLAARPTTSYRGADWAHFEPADGPFSEQRRIGFEADLGDRTLGRCGAGRNEDEQGQRYPPCARARPGGG